MCILAAVLLQTLENDAVSHNLIKYEVLGTDGATVQPTSKLKQEAIRT